ncbi:olfactory receptor 14A16-like [Harpia harpyja]|uniref:olfactory receptor 14A16-like n=1 Tax=Harpia harpyja TaxID=202280 RepID=UPI0022B128D4|nr:olfactory receptor 14A16-like [Harpia harpyja]
MSNSSSITEFLLLSFADTREMQLLHFWLFLGIYLAALLANSLIITAIASDHRLHTPMYFFLLNLSLLDLSSISTTVPKAMTNSLLDTRAISYPGCAAQVFLFVFLMSAEYFLLTVMAYDRYVAICKPLHYGTLLGSRACVHMAAAAWGTGFLYAVLHTANTFSLPLCQGNAVDQFFCEIPQILKLACSDAYLREVGVLVVGVCFGFGCFGFIVLSYGQIFRAVLRIPSEQGRHKAFSMCLPHLAVVSLVISTAVFSYLKPPSTSSPSLDLVLAVLYSVVPPAVNPLIYSMRNQELKDALRKLATEWFSAAIDCLRSFASDSQYLDGPQETSMILEKAETSCSAITAGEAGSLDFVNNDEHNFKMQPTVSEFLSYWGHNRPAPPQEKNTLSAPLDAAPMVPRDWSPTSLLPSGRTQRGGEQPAVDEDQVRGYLSKCTPLDSLHPRVLREPANAIVRTLCIILEQS